jgi:dolichol kinase
VTSADLPESSASTPPAALTHTALREGLRRAVHAGSGVLGLVAVKLPEGGGDVLFGGVLVVALAFEAARHFSPAIQRLVLRAGRPMFRPEELRGVSGPTVLACGYALAWWVFAAPVALAAVLVTALADPAAAVVGRRFGSGARKSWSGSAACAAVAAAVLAALGVSAPAVLATACIAAAAERITWTGIDNLLLPLAVGGTLTLLGPR